jgi:hypothetical protein
MLFKSHYDAVDEAVDVIQPHADLHEVPPAPVSAARQRLAKLLGQRAEANAEMQRARDAIARLVKAQSLDQPFVAELQRLDAAESEALRLWSGDDGDATPPAQDFERRAALERKIGECRSTAAAAQRAIPGLESEYTRASHRALSITWSVSATIGEILLEEVEPDFAAIVEAKASLSAAISRAEHGRETALIGVESIPADRRTVVASGFYTALAALESVRGRAIANPAPSYDRGDWAHLASRLAVDHLAVSGHQAEG